MQLENIVVDAVEPQRLGRLWEDVLGTERLTDEPDIFETRLTVADGPVLDLCLQRVGEPPVGSSRLRLRVGLWPGEADTAPLEALVLDSADPDRDGRFWSWLTGWTEVAGAEPRSLRHPSLRGPLLELQPESVPKGTTKNRMHLDVRLEAGEDPDDVAAGIAERGGRELFPGWGELAWRVYADPSGNEFCVLPAHS